MNNYGFRHVNRDEREIHDSHEFGEKSSSIFVPLSTPRFSTMRECVKCGAEIHSVVTGTWADTELLYECLGGEK
jgi:hypothetical protein